MQVWLEARCRRVKGAHVMYYVCKSGFRKYNIIIAIFCRLFKSVDS